MIELFLNILTFLIAAGAAIVALVVAIMVACIVFLVGRTFVCKHDAGVFENQACDAVCLKCGKNLGFIDTWRKRRA